VGPISSTSTPLVLSARGPWQQSGACVGECSPLKWMSIDSGIGPHRRSSKRPDARQGGRPALALPQAVGSPRRSPGPPFAEELACTGALTLVLLGDSPLAGELARAGAPSCGRLAGRSLGPPIAGKLACPGASGGGSRADAPSAVPAQEATGAVAQGLQIGGPPNFYFSLSICISI
jgi:hypothetical protein